MRKALLVPLFLSAFVAGCATPVSNKTVLESEESILMMCKSGSIHSDAANSALFKRGGYCKNITGI